MAGRVGDTGSLSSLLTPTGTGTVDTPRTEGTIGDHTVRVSTEPEARLGADVLAPKSSVPPHVPLSGVRVTAGDKGLANDAIPSRKGLIDKLGEPKTDRLGGLWKRSTGYKEVLGKVDGYQAALGSCAKNKTPDTIDAKGHSANKVRQIGELLDVMGSLEALEHSLQSYVDGSGLRGNKAEMREMLVQVKAERAMLTDLMHGIDAMPGSPKMELGELVELHRGGMPMAHIKEGLAQGLDLAGFKAYQAAKLPITPGLAVTQFKDDALVAPMRPLGSGNVNEVFLGEYRMPDGGTKEYVFKKEKPEGIDMLPKRSGISETNPNWAGRNIATSKLDARLGLGVIPHTAPAMHNGEMGYVMEKARGVSSHVTGSTTMELPPELAARLKADPGLLADYCAEQGFASGTFEGDKLKLVPLEKPEGEVITGLDYGDPVLRRELTKLQWLDGLCGQMDRHQHNYFVERGPDGRVTGLKGIDNDQAFGSKIEGVDKKQWGHGTKLPDVVDQATYDALKKLTPEQLALDLKGLVTDEEIASAQKRLGEIHRKLDGLKASGHVLKTEAEWSTPEVAGRLGMKSPQEVVEKARGTIRDSDAPLAAAKKISGALSAASNAVTPTSYMARDAWALDRAKYDRAQARASGEAPSTSAIADMGRLREMAARPRTPGVAE